MPGYSKTRNEIQRTGQATRRNISESGQSSASTIAGMASTDYGEKKMELELGAKGQEWMASQLPNYYNALGYMADQKIKKWDWEKRQPYLADAATKSAMRHGFIENTYRGLSQGLNAAQNLYLLKAMGAFGNGAMDLPPESRTGMTGDAEAPLVDIGEPLYGQPYDATSDLVLDNSAQPGPRASVNPPVEGFGWDEQMGKVANWSMMKEKYESALGRQMSWDELREILPFMPGNDYFNNDMPVRY